MIIRTLASFSLALTIAALAALPLSGQSTSAPPLVVTAYNNGPATNYVMPKTPWGDPDLQGVWSSDDTSGIPMSRPADLGTNLYQTDEQWAARQKQTQQGIQNALNAIGTFRGDYARRSFRQTSIIVDRPHGRIHACRGEAARPARSRNLRRWPVQLAGRLHDVRPLHHPRHRRLRAARRLWEWQPHRAGPRHGRDQLRDDPRHARAVHRRTAAHLVRHPAAARRLAGPMGGRGAGGRDDEPDRQDQHRPERQRPAPQRQ